MIETSRSKITEEQRREIDAALHDPEKGLTVKQQFVPLLDAMASELSICPLAFQRRVLQIKNQVSIYNQHVEFLRSQFDRTFDTGLTDANRKALLWNSDQGYRDLGKIAKRIADNVAEV